MSDDRIEVTAVGDVMLGDSAKCIGFGTRSFSDKKGHALLFDGVKGLLAGDIVFGNLECVLSDHAFRRLSFKKAQMCAAPSVAEAMAAAGFNVLSVANNHSMQYGDRVFGETCSLLARHGIAVAGVKDDGTEYTCKPVFMEVRGRRVGILAYSPAEDNYSESPLYAQGSDEEIVSDVKRVRKRCDYALVSMHWGSEFVTSRSPGQAELGRKIIDAGGDLVLGHHPHVVQEIEIYKEKPIVYSLGNFVSDMIWDRSLCDCILVKAVLRRDRVSLSGVHRVRSRYDAGVQPVDRFSFEEYQLSVGGVARQPAPPEAYRATVESERIRQRNLSHLFVFRNFYRYNVLIFVQLVSRSVKSALLGR